MRGARRASSASTEWLARATPAGKVAALDALRAEGHRVLMVGDGLNDAAALAAAHVSISPASAVDASRCAADLIVLGDRLDRVADELAARPHRPAAHPRELRLRLRLQPRHRAGRLRRPCRARSSPPSPCRRARSSWLPERHSASGRSAGEPP